VIGRDGFCSGCEELAQFCQCDPSPEPVSRIVTPPSTNGQGTPFQNMMAATGMEQHVKIAGRYVPVAWADAWLGQCAQVDWLFEPVLEKGTVNALFGKPGAGKSLLALEIALKLVRQDRTVVYIDDENRITDLVERLQAFGADPGELSRLVLYSFAGLPPLDTERGGKHLEALAAVNDAALVVLDTTTRMVMGRENDADTFLQLYRCSLVPLKGRGMTVLRLDHPGKDEGRGQRGSSAKEGDVDTIWRLTEQVQGMEYRLERLKSRSGHGDVGTFRLLRHYEPLRREWKPIEGDRSAAETARVFEIMLALEKAGLPPETGRPTVRAAMKAAGISAPNRLVEAAIRARKTARDSGRAAAGSAGSDQLPAAPPPIGGAAGAVTGPGHSPEGVLP
jgi:AAA domain